MTAPGVPEAMGTSNGLGGVLAYLLLWGAMMSAMMYPAMIPLAREYIDELDSEEPAIAAGFVGAVFAAYSLVWTATGVVPLLVEAVVDISALAVSLGPLVLGGLGLFIAVYQQTAFKLDALEQCCRGVTVEDTSFQSGVAHGVEHGVNCVRSTWPFFAVMVVAGSMNPTVMLALTFVVAAERLPAVRTEFRDAIGLVAGGAGLLVLLIPALLP